MDKRKRETWRNSSRFFDYISAQLYYYNYTKIRQKRFLTKITDISDRSNARLASGVLADIANQRRDYLLSIPPVGLPDSVSIHELKMCALDYILTGQMVMGLDKDGEIKRFPPECVCPWSRKWEGFDGTSLLLELGRGDEIGAYVEDIPEPSWWTFVRSRDSADGIGLPEHACRLTIDQYELLLSRKQDTLADQPNAPMIVKGYLSDPDKFVNTVREDGVCFIAKDGTIEVLEPKVDFDATDLQLDRLLTAAYHAGSAVRPISDTVSTFDSSVALRLLYTDLDARSRALGEALIECLVRAAEAGAIAGVSKVDRSSIKFHLAAVVNENDAVNNAALSASVLSREAIVRHHPWIDDPEEEMSRRTLNQESQEMKTKQQESLAQLKSSTDKPKSDAQRVQSSRSSKARGE